MALRVPRVAGYPTRILLAAGFKAHDHQFFGLRIVPVKLSFSELRQFVLDTGRLDDLFPKLLVSLWPFVIVTGLIKIHCMRDLNLENDPFLDAELSGDDDLQIIVTVLAFLADPHLGLTYHFRIVRVGNLRDERSGDRTQLSRE